MARKAEVGSLMFTREYMCVPISTGTSLFSPEHLENAKNKDLVLKPLKREGYKYFIGVDPAISTDGDYNVITVIEMDANEINLLCMLIEQRMFSFVKIFKK